MKLLKNSEVRRPLILMLVAAAAACSVALLWEIKFGLLVLALSAVLIGVFWFVTKRRYALIAELSLDLDKLLHNDDSISFEKYKEGELDILQSEIYKMTIRLREQKSKLLEDKAFLADSIADISHQIRTPLTSINLIVSMLSEPNIGEERRLKLVQELKRLLSKIDWLITALLKISKIDAGTVVFAKSKTTLEKLIDTACEPLLPAVDIRSLQLKTKAEGFFCGDIAWTSEAIGNVVKNCIEHTPQNGVISIAAKETALFAEIIIQDNGSGFSKEDLPHIFERFYKGKESDESSFGIGLALARTIISSQNGTIKAENAAGGGAKFIIRFYKGTV